MRNSKCTREYEYFPLLSFAAIPGIKSCWKTAYRKCTHFPRWVHNETIAEGEMVIIEAGRNEGVRFFHLTTAQNNNWVRHNYIYENGDCEELFER